MDVYQRGRRCGPAAWFRLQTRNRLLMLDCGRAVVVPIVQVVRWRKAAAQGLVAVVPVNNSFFVLRTLFFAPL